MSRNRLTLVVAVLLAGTTVALYFPVIHHPFLNLDDNQYVTANPCVQDGLTWSTVAWAFTSYDALNWHPLTWLSHATDVQVFGLDPAGHHAINLLLHVLNVILLFLVLRQATGYIGRSAMVAALFAVHPMNVESVAWIAERKNLLSMLFFLLALGSYRWYTTAPRNAKTVRAARYLLVAVCFALGLMAKPQVITLPFVLLLWDYWPLQRMAVGSSVRHACDQKKLWSLLLEKSPLFLLCAASAFVTMQAQRAGGAVASLVKYSLTVRLENALVAYMRYLAKAFWPSKLALMYPHPGNSLKMWQVWLALLLLLGITELVIRFRRRRYLLVGWLWFLGTLVPMIGIVQVGHQAMADRYAYLPFIGVFIMVCWGVADAFAAPHAADRDQQLSPAPRSPQSFVLYASCGVVLLALAIATHRQLQYWRDNLVLWSHVSDVIGPNLISEQRRGDELLKRGKPVEAMQHFARATAIKGTDPDSNFALAVYEQKQGDLAEAIRHYEVVAANAANPQMRARALTYMSYAYRDLGDSERAEESLEAAKTAVSSQHSAVSGQP
jgi:protein O-mannosyl-transferase